VFVLTDTPPRCLSQKPAEPADPIPPDASGAERATWHLTPLNNGDGRRFRRDLFDHLSPTTALALAKTYEDIYQTQSLRAANLVLLETVERCTQTVRPVLLQGVSDEEVCRLAELKAARCREFGIAFGSLGDERRRRERMEALCSLASLEPPPFGRGLCTGARASMRATKPWRGEPSKSSAPAN
jgi:hypothetical protein